MTTSCAAVPHLLDERVAWPVRTERLLLRRGTPADAAASYRIRADDEVARWLPGRPSDEADYTERFVSDEVLPTVVVGELLDAPGEVVLDLMVRVGDAWAQREVAEQGRRVQAELGWVLDPAHAGRGLATEAVRALVALCFDQLGLRRVEAVCFAENEGSWRLMERLGMRREQHLVRDALHRDGTWHDTYGYGLLAEEWPGS